MSKFDTHGGYFAPKDYVRINEGGSHEENPNGGVQLGVDPEGTPNLLEEGEPVYKDYVYSDNIEADEEFLVQNNIPKKYGGKLYSKIADDIFTEAEERPLDPISRNGLETMLGRLADAQEAQKQAQQQRELEEELAQLSPEELDQLEQMLAQGEQPVGTDNPMYGEGPVGAQGEPGILPEQMMGPAEPMPVEGMPMMANGGFLKLFAGGGKKDDYGQLLVDAAKRLADLYAAREGIKETGQPQLDFETEEAISEKIAEVENGIRNNLLSRARKRDVEKYIEYLNGYDINNQYGRFGLKVPEYFNQFRDTYNSEILPRLIEEAPLYSDPTSRAIAKTSGQDINTLLSEAREQRAAIEEPIENPGRELTRAQLALGARRLINGLVYGNRAQKYYDKQVRALDNMLEDYASDKDYGGAYNPERAILNQAELVEKLKTAQDKRNAKEQELLWKRREAEKQVNALRFPFVQGFVPVGDEEDTSAEIVSMPVDTALVTPPATMDSVVVAKPAVQSKSDDFSVDELDFGPFIYKQGGRVNRYDDGSWVRFMDALRRYDRSTRRGGIEGTYAIDRNFPLGTGFRTIEDLENSDAYKDFTEYVVQNYQDPRVQEYLKLLDERTHGGVQKLFDGNALRSNWEELYRRRRGDHKGGIYHFSTGIDGLSAPAAAVSAQPVNARYAPSSRIDYAMQQVIPEEELSPRNAYAIYGIFPAVASSGIPAAAVRTTGSDSSTYKGGDIEPAVTGGKKDEHGDYRRPGALPTWPRYAGAVGAGLLGLYNAFQPADRYSLPHVVPQTPEGRIHLQNQVYNPLDQNMVANAISAQGNATNRALRNSGLGSSSAAAILAADNATTGNLGTGFIQSWDANNQRRNQVIATNNAAEAQRANFDYAVDQQRKAINNQFALQDRQNNLMLQRLNYASEGDRYSAISNQIAAGLQALSGIGRENFAMNQVNSNPAFIGYGTGPNGWMQYNPYYQFWLENKDKVNKG